MKLLSLLSLLILFTFACSKDLTTSKNIVYYYCSSHKWTKEESKIAYILYTDILKINKDEQAIKEKTSDWGNYVKVRCKNTTGCTSDLNIYNSAEEAVARRNEMFDIYKNSEKYQIEKVEFK
ncbi:MAG: hypothetical protein IPI45_14135 [Saprospiraceae bacterium]|nr:hypothetical protein [Saprospiraceae bacterium]MBK7738906.1 hypothetical protein [Saprospiraceae bacterium]MBK7912527.1 hypothetical protein [Saprospiraceae bacterium]